MHCIAMYLCVYLQVINKVSVYLYSLPYLGTQMLITQRGVCVTMRAAVMIMGTSLIGSRFRIVVSIVFICVLVIKMFYYYYYFNNVEIIMADFTQSYKLLIIFSVWSVHSRSLLH